MECRYKGVIKIKIDDETGYIFYKSIYPDIKKEGWEIKFEDGYISIAVPTMTNESRFRGIINSILRQIEALSRLLTVL